MRTPRRVWKLCRWLRECPVQDFISGGIPWLTPIVLWSYDLIKRSIKGIFVTTPLRPNARRWRYRLTYYGLPWASSHHTLLFCYSQRKAENINKAMNNVTETGKLWCIGSAVYAKNFTMYLAVFIAKLGV